MNLLAMRDGLNLSHIIRRLSLSAGHPYYCTRRYFFGQTCLSGPLDVTAKDSRRMPFDEDYDPQLQFIKNCIADGWQRDGELGAYRRIRDRDVTLTFGIRCTVMRP
jgi:hypothetical protein